MKWVLAAPDARRESLKVWVIPLAYTSISLVAGTILPRLEETYVGARHPMAVASAQAFFSAVSSGTMALTGIVFAIAFVIVQFSTAAYSPRIAIMLAAGRRQYHALGLFFATFTYSLMALAWTDRMGSGKVPLVSTAVVIVLLLASMLAFARMIQNIDDLQIHNVLRFIGGQGRAVIDTMPPAGAATADIPAGPIRVPRVQTLVYYGEPWTIVRFDLKALLRLACRAEAVIVLEAAVGETLVEHSVVMRVYGTAPLPEAALMATVHLAARPAFDQDPRYAIRLLVDIAIRALSAAINDPTTAVQALDQIEDLLRRLGQRHFEDGTLRDGSGEIRVVFPAPTWQDYLDLSFDEIRHYGEQSIQVMRRLRAALTGLEHTITIPARREAVQRYHEQLDTSVGLAGFDELETASAMKEDRQGLGLGRIKPDPGDDTGLP